MAVPGSALRWQSAFPLPLAPPPRVGSTSKRSTTFGTPSSVGSSFGLRSSHRRRRRPNPALNTAAPQAARRLARALYTPRLLLEMTYIPQHFRVSDQKTLQEFMRTYDFATVVSGSPDGLVTSHVPVLVRPSGATLVMVGHMARANHH